jgi:hypothetical protein
MSFLTHVDMNLVNSAVVNESFKVSLELREQFYMINEVPICFIQLLKNALGVIVRFAAF